MIRRSRIVALFTAATFVAGGVAQAAWMSSGTGTASAAAGTINPPTNVGATASGQTVWISWSAPLAGATPGSYTVTRGATTICSAAASPCSESNVPGGQHTYSVVSRRSNWASTAATASVTVTAATAPGVTAVRMLDVNSNGKVDAVEVTFDRAVRCASTCSATGWTLTSVPSQGHSAPGSASVAIAGNDHPTVRFAFNEGSGAADTAVGSFTVALASSANIVGVASGLAATFAARTPADGAGPVPVAITTANSAGNGTKAGQIDDGDSFSVSFSEALQPSSVPSTTSVTMTGASSTRTDVSAVSITATDMTLGFTGSKTYVSVGSAVRYASATVTLGNNNRTLTVLLAGSCTVATGTGSCSGNTGQVASNDAGAVSYAPSTALRDAAGNSAVGSRTESKLLMF